MCQRSAKLAIRQYIDDRLGLGRPNPSPNPHPNPNQARAVEAWLAWQAERHAAATTAATLRRHMALHAGMRRAALTLTLTLTLTLYSPRRPCASSMRAPEYSCARVRVRVRARVRVRVRARARARARVTVTVR